MIERNTILQGDSLVLMREIPDKSIDLILTDPPYAILSKTNVNAKWDNAIDLRKMWAQYNRIIKDNGAILIFGQGLFGAKLMMSNPKMFRYDIIWDKNRKSNFLNARKMLMRQHEQVFVFYKKLPTYNPQMIKCAPHQRNHGRGSLRNGITNNCYGKFEAAPTTISDEKYPGTILQFPKGHSKEDWLHPTAKPIPLLAYLIRTYSNEGDLVLDNFAGSGSTLIAAIEEKRDWIGMELSDKYFDICQKRISDRLREPTLCLV